MVLTCPSCATRYVVDEAKLGVSGRIVRCARCAHQWHQAPPEVETVRPYRPPPRPPGTRANLPALRPTRPGPARRLGWAALVLVLAALGAGLVLGRTQIVAMWPASAPLYERAGLGVEQSRDGLAVRNVTSTQVEEGGQQVLIIKGEVANVGAEARTLPRMRIGLRDEARREIYNWTIDPPRAQLAPAEISPFTTRLAGPPPEAAAISVGFAPE